MAKILVDMSKRSRDSSNCLIYLRCISWQWQLVSAAAAAAAAVAAAVVGFCRCLCKIHAHVCASFLDIFTGSNSSNSNASELASNVQGQKFRCIYVNDRHNP